MLRNPKVYDLNLLGILTEDYILWFDIRMQNVTVVEILNSCKQLRPNIPCLVDVKCSFIVLNVFAHIPTKWLHYQMELVLICDFVVFSHEVFVFNDIGMVQLLAQLKFIVELHTCFHCQRFVVANYSIFIDIPAFKLWDTYFVYISCLTSTTDFL